MLLTKENISVIYSEISKQEIKVTPSSPGYQPNRSQHLISEDGSTFLLNLYDDGSVLRATFEIYSTNFKGMFDTPNLRCKYSLPIAWFNVDGSVNHYKDDLLNIDTKITFDRPANREVDLSTDIKITIKGTIWGPIVTTARTYKEDLAPYKDVLVTYHEVTVEYDDGKVYPLADRYYQYTGDYILVKGKDMRASYNFSREVSSNVYNELMRYLDQDFGGLYD